jgi:hypothetical protein
LPAARAKAKARIFTPPPPYSPKRKQVQTPEKGVENEPKEKAQAQESAPQSPLFSKSEKTQPAEEVDEDEPKEKAPDPVTIEA